MKSTKKLIALVLSVLMMLSMSLCATATTFSDVPETHNRYTAITTLADMGVINGYTDGTFKPDSPVTRAEMAKMVALVFNYGLNSATEQPYSDVEKDHWAINYIATMRDVGVINGFPDGTFLPSGEVTYEQAIKMIICALNWGEVAAQQTVEGDWSAGYRAMASKLGVSKYVYPTSNSEPASRSTIAQLLYNALEVKPAEKVVDSNGNVSYKESDKTLNETTSQSLYFTNAQIITTPNMNIDASNSSIADGNIRVQIAANDIRTINVGTNTKVYDYIGKYGDIRFNVNTNGDYSLISFLPKGDETSVELKNIKSVSSGSIEYYIDDNFEKTAKLTVNNPTVIYNNRALVNSADFVSILEDAISTSTTDGTALNFFGTLQFTDYSAGDLLVINAYKSYEAQSVDTKTYNVTLAGLNSPLYMPVKDQSTKGYEIIKKTSLTDKGTSPTSLSISTGAVVTVAHSYMTGNGSVGDKYIEYFVNNSTSSITPTGTEQLTSRPYYCKKVSTDSKDYYVTNQTAANQLVVGATSTYLTDASGDIVLVKSYADKSKRVGLFMSGSENKDDDTTSVTFYDPTDGSTFTVKIQNKDDVKEITDNMRSGDLFWMNVNNNKVTSGNIKKVSDGGSYESLSEVKVVDCSNDTTKKASKVGSTYTVDGTTYSSNSYTVKVFTRPDDMSTANKFSYSTFSMASSLNYTAPKLISFKKDDKAYMVMWINSYKGLLDSSPIYIVKEIGSETSDGETKIKTLTCYDYKNGTEGKTVKFEVDALNSLALEVGDMFTYYNDCTTDGVDIDKTENVKILVRASKLAKDKTYANSMEDRLTDSTTSTTGYKKYGIYENNITGTYYNYLLTTPVNFSNDNNNAVLYLAKKKIDTYLLDDFESLLSGTVGADWTFENVSTALNGKMIDVDLTKCKNVFVYDKDGSTEEEKFYKLSEVTADTLSTLFSEVNTLFKGDAPTSAADITAKAENSAMVYTYFSNNDVNINAIYIIK